MVAGRDEHEREHLAGQRLGLGSETLMDAAAALIAEEDAAAIGVAVQLVPSCTQPARVKEERQPGEVRLALPTLGRDACTLLLGHRNPIFTTAATAAVAIPVLDDG